MPDAHFEESEAFPLAVPFLWNSPPSMLTHCGRCCFRSAKLGEVVDLVFPGAVSPYSVPPVVAAAAAAGAAAAAAAVQKCRSISQETRSVGPSFGRALLIAACPVSYRAVRYRGEEASLVEEVPETTTTPRLVLPSPLTVMVEPLPMIVEVAAPSPLPLVEPEAGCFGPTGSALPHWRWWLLSGTIAVAR